MNESRSELQFSEEDHKKQELERYLSLAKELSQNPEGFSFPGVDEGTLEKLKAVDEEYPGYTTPTVEIIARMEKEGIKVAFGEHPESGNVFVLPFLSDNVGMDSLFPRHLKITPDMDESFQSLILAHKARFNSEQEKLNEDSSKKETDS